MSGVVLSRLQGCSVGCADVALGSRGSGAGSLAGVLGVEGKANCMYRSRMVSLAVRMMASCGVAKSWACNRMLDGRPGVESQQ